MQSWWRFVVGLVVTAAAIAAVLVAWPDDDGPGGTQSGARPPTTASGTGVPGLGTPNGEPDVEPDGEVPDDLFAEGAAEALAELLAAAGGPLQLMEVAVYPE